MYRIELQRPLVAAPSPGGDFDQPKVSPGIYSVIEEVIQGGNRWLRLATDGLPWIVAESPRGTWWVQRLSDPNPPSEQSDGYHPVGAICPYNRSKLLRSIRAVYSVITEDLLPPFLMIGICNRPNYGEFDDWIGFWDTETDELVLVEGTCDPGLEPIQGTGNFSTNSDGAAQVATGLHQNCWTRGFHQGKQSRPALKQTGKIRIHRLDKAGKATKVVVGYYGINFHDAKGSRRDNVGDYSHGCQVVRFQDDYRYVLEKAYKALENLPALSYLLLSDYEVV